MKITNSIHELSIPYQIRISDALTINRNINIYLIIGQKGIVLIDSGVKGCEEAIFKYLESIGHSKDEIKYVLLTHAHPVHIGALAEIKNATNCEIGIHQNEKEWLENIDLQYNDRPFPDFYKMVDSSTTPDFTFSDNEILDLDEKIRIKVIHTQGHSKGSVCFLYQQENALFTGDAIPLMNEFPLYDSWKDSIASLEKIENLPYAKILLPSKGKVKKNDQVQDAISEGFDSIYRIVSIIEKVKTSNRTWNAEEITQLVLAELKLSPDLINPLFIKIIENQLN
jgi:glyoxylase-like metal-dependent hydrolase (beta-lactamase superfamily II)